MASTCVVCLDAPATHGFVCKVGVHLCICEACKVEECPVCQGGTLRVQVFDVGAPPESAALVQEAARPNPTALNLIEHHKQAVEIEWKQMLAKRDRETTERRERARRTWAAGLDRTSLGYGVAIMKCKQFVFVPCTTKNAVYALLDHNAHNDTLFKGRYTTAKAPAHMIGDQWFIVMARADYDFAVERLTESLFDSKHTTI